MTQKKSAQEMMKFKGNAIIEGLVKICFIFAILTVLFASDVSVSAQTGGGFEPQKSGIAPKADQNLRSLARINPSTLAMEMSVPLMSYPGRGGNGVPVSISYSSKVWQMNSAFTWWYGYGNNQRRYVTDTYVKYAEYSAAGWTSSLQPPRLDSETETYNFIGKPYGDSLDVGEYNSSFFGAIESLSIGNLPIFEDEIFICRDSHPENPTPPVRYCYKWTIHFKQGDLYGDADPTVQTPTPNDLYYVKRLRVVMPDGSSHEFRQNDSVINCGNVQTGCTQNYEGTYLSTDGSGMRLEVDDETGSILYLPNGGKYVFPASSQSINGHFATEFTDSDGNKTTFTEESDPLTGKFIQKTTDTLGRVVTEPIPHNWETQFQTAGTEQVSLPGLGGNFQQYQITWANLKPRGCEEDTSANCVGENNQTGGALEDQTQKLFYETRFFCHGNLKDDLLVNPDDFNDPANEVLFPATVMGIRPCTGFNVQRDERGDAERDENNNPIIFPVRFNPVVLSEITLPNGKKYIFKYNRYGEITKITYPTGSYETFVYGHITPMSYSPYTYTQTNRGVTERRVYNADGVLEQKSTYSVEHIYNYPNTTYKVTTIGSKGDNANVQGMKSERFLHIDGGNFGFNNAKAGMPKEEKTYDENGVLRSRTLTEYISKDYVSPGPNYIASRDVRVSKSVSIMIEGDKALATLSENVYDDTGSADAAHFSHLNVKQSKSYHYKSISVSTAQSADLATIAGLFAGETPATLGETDYIYNADYKARGIASLPIESRVLNPQNPSDVLAKTQTVFDNQIPSSNPNYTHSTENYNVSTGSDSTFDCSDNQTPKICWQNPNSTRLGRATTSRLWDKDTNTWIESHTKYDIFGNAVKVKDAIGNEASTTFTANYKYAYPETVIMPAPDPTNTTGTNQTSQASTTYDFTTGLPLTVTNDFGRTIQTEYNDSLLRPTRTFAVNFTAPETQMIYDDNPASVDGDPISVKVRKQIDATNWDEAETFVDNLGRAVKTQAKDSQGDVFVETEYDNFGRVKRASNPYRLGDTKYWSKPRYDELGRAVESYAPAIDGQTGASLGVTSFSISDVPNFVGTVVTSMDASLRKSRSITNGLGQLIRVDEATATGGDETADLGSLESPNQPTFYNYAPQGQMVKVQQGNQNRYFKYDSLGRLIRVKQPEQQANDHLDLADDYNPTGKWSAAFSYDLAGNLRRATDAEGVNIISEYDKANRAIRRCYTKPQIQTSATACVGLQVAEISENTPSVQYFYDGFMAQSQPPTASPNFAKGKLTRVDNGISQTRYLTFDNLGRLTSSEQKTPVGDETMWNAPARVSLYEYNFAGALIKETYPSGREVRNEFESDGDLSRIYGKANSTATERTYANSFLYTADGRISQLKLGNGLWESAKFNNRLQVTEFNLGIGVTDASKWKLTYEYGELQANGTVDTTKNTGNIAKQTSSFAGLQNPFVQTFKYDSLYRLKEAKETVGTNPTPTWKQNFGYDRFGNRTNFTDEVNGQTQTNTALTHPTIDANTNRFVANQGYLYDKNGNLTNDPTNSNRTFTFNGENKQTEVKDASGNPIGKYFYDGEGKRVKKIVPSTGETTVFVYSNGKLVAEYSTLPPPTNPTTSYTMTDQLDSPRVITNALGEVTSRRDFKPFGEELGTDANHRTANRKYGVSDNIRQKFTGYQKDTETQLDFAEARMYQNLHGRFTAVDPLLASGKSANPQTFNRYVYVLNNPLVLTDPSGLQVGWYYNKKEEDYQQFDGSAPKGWSPVNFGNRDYKRIPGATVDGKDCACNVYLYKAGGMGTDKSNPTSVPAGNYEMRLLSESVTRHFNAGIEGIGQGAANFGIGSFNNSPFNLIVSGVSNLFGASNPFQIERYSSDNPFGASYSSATETGLNASAIFVGGVFSGGGSLPSVVPRGNAFSSATQSVTSMSKYDLEFTNRVTGGSLRENALSIFNNGVKEPVKFVKIDGTNFIVDGNNRTALTFIFKRPTVPAQEVSLPFGQFRTSADVINSAVPRTEILNSSAVRFFRRPSQ